MKVMLNTAVNSFRQFSTALFWRLPFAEARWCCGAVLPALAIVTLFAAVSSCGSYDPLPPKTEASTSYYIPDPVAPTQVEIDGMKAERAEYNELTR